MRNRFLTLTFATLLSSAALVATPARALTGPLYGLGPLGGLYSIDPGDAGLAHLGNLAVTNASGLVWDPVTHRLWFADHVGGQILIKSLEIGTFAISTVTTLSGFADERLRDLAILPDGSVYAMGWTPESGQRHELYAVDRTTGAATSLLAGLSGGIAALDATTLLYLAGNGTIDLGTLVPADDSAAYTGALTTKGTQLAFAADENATYLLEGCNLFCSGSRLYRIDRTAKTFASLGTPSQYLSGIAVPEPGVAALLVAALPAWLLAQRRASRR